MWQTLMSLLALLKARNAGTAWWGDSLPSNEISMQYLSRLFTSRPGTSSVMNQDISLGF